MKRVIGLCLAAVLLGGAPAVRADFLVNGGFETGDFTGWTLSGNTGFSFVNSVNPQAGGFVANLGPVGSLGFLSQTVATTPGTPYNIAFYLASDGKAPNEFGASFGGVTLMDQSNVPAQGYTLYQFTATATSDSSVLQFSFRNDPGFFQLDSVSGGPTSPKQTPEPGTLTLLAVGLAGLAGLSRRRRLRGRRSA
jgi:hypothetical protein